LSVTAFQTFKDLSASCKTAQPNWECKIRGFVLFICYLKQLFFKINI